VESVTFTVTLKEPEAVGVPEMAPAEESVRPGGNEPELIPQVYGVTPPVASKVAEYASPACPDGIVVLVIWREVVAAATVMLSCALAVCAGEEESAT
jgi:hypothetical protein